MQIVLFVAPRTGTTLDPGNVGYFSDKWLESNFAIFTGVVELSNNIDS